MNNVETVKQLGLIGFGKETDEQLSKLNEQAQLKEKVEEDIPELTLSKEDKEKSDRRRVVPVGTIVYRVDQPDKPFSVPQSESFYVLLSKNKSRATVKRVMIDSPQVKLYRDGQYYTWVNDPSLADDQREYVPVIEVHSRRLVKPKEKK